MTAFVSSAILGCIYMYKITQQEGTKSLVCGPTVYKNKPRKEKCKCEKKRGGGQSRGHVKCVHVKIMLLHLCNTDSLEKLYLPQTMSKAARKHFMQIAMLQACSQQCLLLVSSTAPNSSALQKFISGLCVCQACNAFF